MFHICEEGKKISFLCPNGTIFEQADLICEWWYKVDCTNAPNLYQESAEFLREDLARRKASRRITLDGRERNHGAIMRIEESASVSVQQNGKPLRVGTGGDSRIRGQVGGDGFRRLTTSSSRSSSNIIQSAINKDVQNTPQKRYNDADTGNFINNGNEGYGVQYAGPSSPGEKQVYTRSTTPSSLGSSVSNLEETPSRKQLNKNRGSVKFSSGFGSKIASIPVSTLKPTTGGYDLAFPTHRSEVIQGDFRSKPLSGRNRVDVDSSKVNLGQPRQKSTVALTRNDILNRRLEPSDSDELQIPQETAAFSPNSYNSIQSSTRKFTSSPYPNHRPTYSDLKRPEFSSAKLVNPINSVTPQYITTQSINSGKPFVGSTVGGNIFNTNLGKTQQKEEAIKPVSTTERLQPIVSTYQTFDSNKQGFSSTPQDEFSNTQQNEITTGPLSTTERAVPYTVQPVVSSTYRSLEENNLGFSVTPQEGFSTIQQSGDAFGVIYTTERAIPYTAQPVISSTYHTVNSYNQGVPSTLKEGFSGIEHNEERTGPFSTTERTVFSTSQPAVSSTYQTFVNNNQGFSSTSRPGFSNAALPSVEGITTRTVDHATVYGSFSREPTTAAPPNGVEVKLGKNVEKISIQLSKSLGGEPPKYSSTVGPQLATDGFVRITAGLPQPVSGGISQISNLRAGTGKGPSSQSGKGIAAIGERGTPIIENSGYRTVDSTVTPNALTFSEETTPFSADVPASSSKGGSTLAPSLAVTGIHVDNFQSSTGSPSLIETEIGITGNLENFANRGTLSPVVAISPNIGSTVASSTVSNINIATGRDTINRGTTYLDRGVGGTATPNVQISTGSVGGTLQPAIDVTGSTVSPNVEGSTGVTGSIAYESNTGIPLTDGGVRTPVSNVVLTGISGSTLLPNLEEPTGLTNTISYDGKTGVLSTGSVRTPVSNVVSTKISGSTASNIIGENGLLSGATGITVVPNVVFASSTVQNRDTLSSSVRPDVFISESSRNTVSPPAAFIPETTVGSFAAINGTDTRLNSFRPNFYPTRVKDNTRGKIAKPTVSIGSQGPALEDNSYQSTPSSVKIFLSENRPQPIESNLSQNDIGSTLSPVDEISTYRSTQSNNDYNAFKSSSATKPLGDSSAKPGTGFYVTKNSVYSSTTPAPFGLSRATTSSSYESSTPLVNVSPNSGEEGVTSLDITLSPPIKDSLSRSETRYPRPFQKSPNSIDDESSGINSDSVTPTYFTYKISSARPFELPKDKITPAPTIPTPFTTARSVQENVDDMINTLQELVGSQDYSSETPRPGLIVPPSAGPQTLHTLAQYFANALDGIVAEREKETGEELDPESKEKLTSLLTQMTMYRYNELFKGTETSTEDSEKTTTVATEDELEGDDSNNLVETPELRQLARNFSLALSSYLNDPDTFRRELENFRPTEPSPTGDEVTESGVADEELLNFSDADSKTSFNPLLPTPHSPAPTWGFIVAHKPSGDSDVKNSLNPDLHTADTQSFVPGFNNLAANTGKDGDKGLVDTKKDLSGGHWTTSPGVTKLWQSALSVNPAVLNENLDNTRPISHTTESYIASTTPTSPDFPQSEIQYDFRALPKLTLNSTQVHGILIDFVNTTKPDDSNRLQRLLKKLNTTEDEFLHRMKEIESNPLTKRLILLLISECGANVTKDLEEDPIHSLSELLNSSSVNPPATGHQESRAVNSDIPELVDPSLQQDDQDTRALQLLNSLYAIASKFGK